MVKLRRLIYRILFVIKNPLKSISFVLSKQEDYSRIPSLFIEKYLAGAKLIVEAGAADGVDTMRFARDYPNSRVLAVEPVYEQFLYLQERFSQFKKVTILNFALSNQDGIAKIYLGGSEGHLGGLGSSSLLPPDQHQSYFPEIEFSRIQEVRTVTLETLLENESEVDLLWLDIQGKELEVLSSSLKTFSSKIKAIHLEISRVQLYVGMPKERELRKFLKSAGFRCVIDRVGAISGNAIYVNNRFFPI